MSRLFSGEIGVESQELYALIKNYPTIFFFLGKKINRGPIFHDRELLNKQQIKLRKIKNLAFKALHYDLIVNKHVPIFYSYNLIGTSKKLWSTKEIQTVFNTSFPNVVPISVITQGVAYTPGRIVALQTLSEKQQSLPFVLKIIAKPHFGVLTKTILAFLYYNAKNWTYGFKDPYKI